MFAFLVALHDARIRDQVDRDRLAAGIIFDATVIRALLVPALMRLLGEANWWMPGWTGTLLRIPPREPVLEDAPAAASASAD